MIEHNIQAILIKDKAGMPLFFVKLDPKAMDLDPMLVSGFFTAIRSFSSQVIDKNASRFQVDYGARQFMILSAEDAELIAVSIGKWRDDNTPIMMDLLDDFEANWIPKITPEQLDQENIMELLDPFKEVVLNKLSIQLPTDKWVPFIHGEEAGSASPILNHIDGARSVARLIEESGLSREVVLDELARLWVKEIIGFHNMLDLNDIVQTTTKLQPLLQSSSSEWVELTSSEPDLATVVPRLVGLFDGRRTVGDVVSIMKDQFAEQMLFRALDFLLDKKAIEPFSPEKRRILLIKEATEICLRIAEQVYTQTEARSALENALKTTKAPEVVSDIRLEDGQWTVEYDSSTYDGLESRRKMDMYGEWMKVVAQFTASLPAENLPRFTEALIEGFNSYLFKRFTDSDLRGFEEMSFWLEILSVRK